MFGKRQWCVVSVRFIRLSLLFKGNQSHAPSSSLVIENSPNFNNISPLLRMANIVFFSNFLEVPYNFDGCHSEAKFVIKCHSKTSIKLQNYNLVISRELINIWCFLHRYESLMLHSGLKKCKCTIRPNWGKLKSDISNLLSDLFSVCFGLFL